MKKPKSKPESVLERLAKTNPGLEVWWDSSPLVYENWAKCLLAEVSPGRRSVLAEQLKRLYDPEDLTQGLFKGVTTNPPLSLNAIKNDPVHWGSWVDTYVTKHPGDSVEQVFWALYKEVVKRGAEIFLPVFEDSGYRYGFLSGQLDPRVAFDKERMLNMALELAALSPNIMVKVPGSAEGMWVLEELTARGIATNATLCFVVPQFVAVAEAVLRGLARARSTGVDLTQWRSVVTDMSTRWENGTQFKQQAADRGLDLTLEDRRWASVAIFKHAFRLFRQRAYPSKMLICSLRLGPEVAGIQRVWHLEHTAGADAVFTCPPKYISQLVKEAEHIDFTSRIWEDIPDQAMARLRQIPYFVKGYEEDGYTQAEFNTLEPLLSTYYEFSAATEKMVDFVRDRMALKEAVLP
jgi:transaldolase